MIELSGSGGVIHSSRIGCESQIIANVAGSCDVYHAESNYGICYSQTWNLFDLKQCGREPACRPVRGYYRSAKRPVSARASVFNSLTSTDSSPGFHNTRCRPPLDALDIKLCYPVEIGNDDYGKARRTIRFH